MEGNEAVLVARARDGDSEAFRELVEAHSRHLYALGFRLTGNAHTAEDVVQETFLKAHQNLHRFDGRAAFGTWLHRIAVNCSMDWMRKKKRRDSRAPFDDWEQIDPPVAREAGPERRAMSAELATKVRATLHTLSSMERTAFILRHFEGYTTAEISDALGVRASASKQAVFRAVKKLREALKPMLEEHHETAL